MKKSMILLGMLSIGYANAQEYDGKVGINTTEPKATLDITPEATNLAGTTNEGIIAPRLTKERIANIAVPVEGTLVYATDATYTGNNAKVVKITEKGYYFYNGTEWVKVQYKDTNDAEWVYDDATKRINLKRSGQTTGFVNKVYYDAQTGQFFNIQNDSFSFNGETVNVDGKGVYNLIQKETPSLTANVTHNNTRSHKVLQNLVFNVNEQSTLASFRPSGLINQLRLLETNQSASYWVQAASNTVLKNDNTTTNFLMGVSNGAYIYDGNVSGYITGTRSETHINMPKDLTGSARGISSYLSVGAKTQSVRDLLGMNSYVSLSNATVKQKAALYSGNFEYNNVSPNVPMLVGYYYGGLTTPNISNIQNTEAHYGIYLEDVKYAKNNYAIYSNVGKVRVGDLADATATGNRQVVVDADGVLKVGTAAASTGATTLTGEENLECNEANRGKMNFVKNDAGFDVFGICMKGTNGYSWRYIYGNGGVSTGSGNFGSGLQ